MNMKVLDLFSGIGGFSLGLERAGMETIAFCEFEKHAQNILKNHWPNVPIFKDVVKLHAKDIKGSIDIVCGGFPCQDLSHAGKQNGLEGSRSGLWKEMHRLVGEIMPKYVLVENVTALLNGNNGRWFGQLLKDLAEIGYDAEWHCIPAAAVGAHHIRDRVWVLAYPHEMGRKICDFPIAGRPLSRDRMESMERAWWSPQPSIIRMVDGISTELDADRIARCGNTIVPQIAELFGEWITLHHKAITKTTGS